MMETNKPLLSIIVPVYQIAEYLEKCVNSIMNQTYTNLQIILVDDGSSDKSSEICDLFASLDDRIEAYHKENGGLVSARKYGMEKARGQYIGFVDGDDYVEKEMYEELLSKIQESGADFVHSGYWEIGEKKERRKVSPGSFIYSFDDGGGRRTDLIEDCFFGRDNTRFLTPSIWSKLFRTDFIKRYYSFVPDELSYGEDVLSLFCCLAECTKFVSVGESYYNYVIRKGSLSNVNGEVFFVNEIKLYYELYRINEMLSLPVESEKIFKWIRKKTLSLMIHTMESDVRFGMEQYFFPDIKAIEGKKTIIYGAGTVGKDYLFQMTNNRKCNVMCLADNNWEKIKWNSINVCSPGDAIQMDYDVIVIAIWDEVKAEIIKNELVDIGVNLEKIIWEKPGF